MTIRAISVDFPSKWNELRDVCCKVIRCQSVNRERWNASFGDIYALCVSRPVQHASKLYEGIASLLKSRVCEIANELTLGDNDVFLNQYVLNWEIFYRGLGYLDRMCSHLNAIYVNSIRPFDTCYGIIARDDESTTMAILELGLSHWKTHLIEPLHKRLTLCLLNEINLDRNGEIHSQSCILPCLDSLICVNELKPYKKTNPDVYREIFELPFLEDTRAYYNERAECILASVSCTEYVKQALNLRSEETIRAEKYYRNSLVMVENLLKDILVEQRLDFLNSSIHDFVKNENKPALIDIFRLLSPTNQCAELLKCFGAHIRCLVEEAISNTPSDQNLAPAYFVDILLHLRSRFVEFIEEVFDGMSVFRNEMDKAFSQAINCNPTSALPNSRTLVRAAEFLSRHIDNLLRKSTKKYTVQDVDANLTASMALFKYIEEKEVFRKYYQRNLSYRLIFSASTNIHLEESAINQLNKVCGHEFTSKFQRMFNDIQLSIDINTKFQKYLLDHSLELDFSHHFKVLTLSSWPIPLKSLQFSLPVELLTANKHFDNFYNSEFNGRKLKWSNLYSTVELHSCYTDKSYTIILNSLNAFALLLFDKINKDRLTVSEISDAMQSDMSELEPTDSAIPENVSLLGSPSATTTAFTSCHASSALDSDALKRALTPLIDANLLSLKNGSKNHTFNNLTGDDVVELNRSFTSKRLKVKINFFPQIKEQTQEDFEQVEKQVEEDRRFFTQAAIVRLMKVRKTCKHTLLIKEILDISKGGVQPSIPLIKRCIETLIEKGYLERCPNDADQYNYIS